ncbi:MAG TPA: hypothetical protein VEU47_18040 [Candidatus Cybelea sp.]|nr:hypothetical protein [Candidatus Cybelea sp.]
MPDPTQQPDFSSTPYAPRNWAAAGPRTPQAGFASGMNLADAADTPSADFTFKDVLDSLNPLQHLPVVSWIYRQVSGEEISPQAHIVGDTLFGGIAGLFSGMANAVLQNATGKDIGQQVIALFSGGGDKPTAVAAAASGGASPAGASTSSPAQATTTQAAGTPDPEALAAIAPAAGPSAAATTAPIASNSPPAESLQSATLTSAPDAIAPVVTAPSRTSVANKPAVALRGAAPGTSPSGLSLADYRANPVPLAATAPPARVNASYQQALDLARKLQSYYQQTPTSDSPGGP